MVAGKREVGDGVGIDAAYQHFSEAPHWQGAGETIEVVDDAATGDEFSTDVPSPTEAKRPAVEGDRQTRLDEWGWSG